MASLVDNPEPDAAWLARAQAEPVLEPELPIVDAHHHLWDSRPWRYKAADYLSDVATGHHVTHSVFVEGGGFYRLDEPERLRSVSEVEAARGAAEAARGSLALCTAIVAYADLQASDVLVEVLDALELAGRGRLRGVRFSAASHPDPLYRGRIAARPAGLLALPEVRRSVTILGERGLVFETWVLHEQLDELADLARRCPGTIIVVDHLGGPFAVGRYAQDAVSARRSWMDAMQRLAALDNVRMKLSGLGMTALGARFRYGQAPPASDRLANAWSVRILPAIEVFGPERCMFGSNFPVDKSEADWVRLWNAFKTMTRHLPTTQRAELFTGSAFRTYRLKL